jgi:hypothetical protein
MAPSSTHRLPLPWTLHGAQERTLQSLCRPLRARSRRLAAPYLQAHGAQPSSGPVSRKRASSLGFPARHGANDMDDASKGHPSFPSPSQKKQIPRPPVMRRRPGDCATRATFSVLVSPHGGAFRAARAASRAGAGEQRVSARPGIQIHMHWWGLARYLGASSQPSPPHRRAGHQSCPVLNQPAASGSDRAITTPAVFLSAHALCHHARLARLARLLVTCATRTCRPLKSDHVGVIARLAALAEVGLL